MKINRKVAAGITVVLGAGALANWRTQDFGAAQATNDRQTVDCLTNQLTREEKQRIAQLTAEHAREAVRAVYMGIFPRCVVRRDQWERSSLLIMNARTVLKYDPEFKQMLAVGSLIATKR